MEEDLNENDLKERLYSRLYYADETQKHITTNLKDVNLIDYTPQRPPIRRYWHTNGDQTVPKVNPAKGSNQSLNKTQSTGESNSKEDKLNPPSPSLSVDLSIFQTPVPQFVKKSIEIIENDALANVVELESSDEDEVIEVKLPPKPTITIESSDDELSEVTEILQLKNKNNNIVASNNKTSTNGGDREVSASPVPSIVSSVSDEFIRGDCIALNISSKRPNNHSFDFSLHGSDIIDQTTPSKRKKKKKNKDTVTSTPIITSVNATSTAKEGEYFATPKSKAKNKRQKGRNYLVLEKSIPNPDVYDSDSNLSINDADRRQNSYSVTDKSFPSTDVYESDSNQSEKTSPPKANRQVTENVCTSPDSNICVDTINNVKETSKSTKQNNSTGDENLLTVDLTETTFTNTIIDENIVMANVTGFRKPENIRETFIIQSEATKYGSTNVPAILYEDLDFDNLKGKEKVCKKRRYSLSTLRAEMEKFYNESWGGENFNHREIQKNMSRDKSLWVIDPKDRMPGFSKRKPTCNYCNRPGHRDDACRMKPPICYMCGSTGHYEPRCPRKICVNCGSPNHMYTTMCRNCWNWNTVRCVECGQIGHPSTHCPDVWRRYHNTITCNTQLEENRQIKKNYQMFCSGCARRGHLIHTCRLSLPFSGLPINSPYVALYHPLLFTPDEGNDGTEDMSQKNRQLCRTNTQDSTISSVNIAINKNDRNKRQSNSPVRHETHLNKRRNTFNSDEADTRPNTKSPIGNVSGRKTPQSKDQCEDANKPTKDTGKIINNIMESSKTTNFIEKAPDFILISSTNHDKKGQIIQDNEVSDTSDVVTSARVYITNEIGEKLKTKDGDEWLKKTMVKHNVTIQNTDFNLFIGILGKVGDQEAFHAELREWIKNKEDSSQVKPSNDSDGKEKENDDAMCNNIPRNRYNVLRKINKALESLKEDLGDPKDIYKELTFLQNHHEQLLKHKEISPKQLSNNRENINAMLKKLNMVLLGQAGLANGANHLNELYSLQEKLSNYRQKYIPPQMRREIGEHFHCIFTALPRVDYQELLSKYYTTRAKLISFKKKKGDKSARLSPVGHVKKRFVRNWQKKKVEREEFDSKVTGNTDVRKPLREHTINKLFFYQRRLMSAKPHNKVLNKTRVELVNQLNSHISSLGQNNKISPKSFKKMRKRMKITQEQAQLFLTNV